MNIVIMVLCIIFRLHECAVVFFDEDLVIFEELVAYDISSVAFGFASKVIHLFNPCLVDRGGDGQEMGRRSAGERRSRLC